MLCQTGTKLFEKEVQKVEKKMSPFLEGLLLLLLFGTLKQKVLCASYNIRCHFGHYSVVN